ncbi:VOC family protein [Lysinibacillus sphaericus]|uniref:VOC family protein n=1 Tax=Lysinibacillus sphaericus TaxID=1421 RepID=UPI001C5FCDEF
MTKFITHIATIEIPVTNLKSAIDFYSEILSVKTHSLAERSAMLTFSTKGVPTLYLVQTEENVSLSFQNTNNDVVHSIIDFYTSVLQGFYNWLKKKNVEVGTLNINHDAGYGGFSFKDPDGNTFSACNILHPGQ